MVLHWHGSGLHAAKGGRPACSQGREAWEGHARPLADVTPWPRPS